MAGKAQQQEHGEEEQRQVPIPGSFLFCVPSGTSVGWCGLHPEWAGLTSRVGGAPACGDGSAHVQSGRGFSTWEGAAHFQSGSSLLS